jgi:hypothetical protein
MSNHGDRESGGQQLHDLILLTEKLLELLVLGIILLDPTSCLVFRQEFIPLDRPTLKDHIDSCRLELVDQGLELPKEVINNRCRTHEKTATGSVTQVHKIDTED